MKRTVLWLWKLIQPYKWRVLLGAFLVSVTVLANSGLLATSSVLLAKAALLPPILVLMPFITGVRFFGIARAVLRYTERLYNHSVAFRILGGMRVSLYNRLEPLVPDKMPHYTEGKMYQQLIKDIDTLRFFYLRVVSIPLGAILVVVYSSVFVSLFVYEAGFILAAALILTMVLIVLNLWKRNECHEVLHREVRSQLADGFSDFIHGIAELKGAPGRDAWRESLFQYIKKDLLYRRKKLNLENIIKRLISFCSHMTVLLLLYIVLPYVETGVLDGIYFAMIGLVALAAFESIQQFPQSIMELQNSLHAAKDMVPIMSQQAKDDNDASMINPTTYDLNLDEVSFHYHNKNLCLLENISMSIPEGSRVAFVGASGSGKSSLARLLLKLWEPDEGTLYIGDCSYSMLSGEIIRQYVSLLEQEPSFFHATLRENLMLANVNADEMILWDVLRKVNLDDKISSLPKKLDEPLGENAMRLSGGEKQRLALARILLKDAPIMILDEPLQNLDGITATMLEEVLHSLDSKKTLIIITHELKKLPDVDYIYLFKNGKIVTSGTHDECLATSAMYQAFWTLEQQRV